MPDLDATTLAAVAATLDESLPDGRHWRILELLDVVGVADALQLQAALTLSRDQFALAMQRMAAAAPGVPPLTFQPRDKVVRPGRRGTPPTIYCLGPTGAALLRRRGHRHAQPCALDAAADISHALAVLDLRLLAQTAGLAVLTEKRLPPGDATPFLRPDNLVTLPGGTVVIFETEQLLTAQHIARAVTSLQHKVRFFQTPADDQPSPHVRVLFNLPPGKDFERTLKVWQQAARVVAQRHGGTLPFQLYAMPLEAFNAAPDWEEPPQSHRWTELTPPLAPTDAAAPLAPPAETRLAPALPKPLRTYTSHESALILQALWLSFQESGSAPHRARQQPDGGLFEVAGIIYAAARGSHLTPLERAAYPHAALYLLRQYLRLEPALYKLLQAEIPRGAQAIRWNSIAIAHRMQVVSGKFLKYHGFGDDNALLVRALSADWALPEPQHFQVRVTLREPEALMLDDGLVPDRALVQVAEAALGWVLTALFAHSEALDLPRAPFW